MSLTTSEIQRFAELLTRLQQDLQAQYLLGQAAAAPVVLDQSKVGRLSRMDAMQQQNMAQSNSRQIEQRLRRVARALDKIKTGEYGYCDTCGEDIASARLQVQPEANLCLTCQTQAE